METLTSVVGELIGAEVSSGYPAVGIYRVRFGDAALETCGLGYGYAGGGTEADERTQVVGVELSGVVTVLAYAKGSLSSSGRVIIYGGH